jgi:internalin A
VFLKVMEKFDLSYPVVFGGPPNQPSTTSLIAQLVGDDRPASLPGWGDTPGDGDAEQRQVCRIVDDKGQAATAEGLFYQLIVRLHRFSLGRDEYSKSVHWQRGLMLDNSYNGRALLEHLGTDVRITVRAAYPAQFLGYLTTEVKSLVESFWKGIRCEVTVPCVEPCGLGRPGRGLFEVGKLVAAVRQKKSEFPCGVSGCDQWQSIDALLQNAPARRRYPA